MTWHNPTLGPRNVKKYGLFKSGWEHVIASRLNELSQVWLKTYAGAADTSQNSLRGLSVDRSSHPHLILNFNQILKAHIIFVQLKKSRGGLQPNHLLLTSRGFQPGFFSEQASAENGFLQSFKNMGLPWAAVAWCFVGNYAFFAFYFLPSICPFLFVSQLFCGGISFPLSFFLLIFSLLKSPLWPWLEP